MTGGGVLAFSFLRRAGYKGKLEGTIDIRREYLFGKPVCDLRDYPVFRPKLIIEDIIASGQTLAKALSTGWFSDGLEVACLMASSNIPQGKNNYRERSGSTIPYVKTLYCPKWVNGCFNPDGSNQKPAILSLRYLLTKAVENDDYRKEYLSKKFGGEENSRRIASLLMDIDRRPIDLLRINPASFLEEFGN